MTERTEWPTAEKIERLRSEGIVSYSSTATGCFVVGTVALVANGLAPEWGELIARYRTNAVTAGLREQWWSLLGTTAYLLAVLGGVVAVLVLLSVVGQTRFLFMPVRLAPRFDRLFPSFQRGLGGFLARRMVAVVRLLGGVVVAGALFFTFFRDMAGSLNHGLDYLVVHLRGALEGAFGKIAVGAFGCGIVAGGVEWFTFRLRHRMTRAEVLADRAER